MSPRSRKSIIKKKGIRHWTKSETRKLLKSIKAQLKQSDPLAYSKRIKALNWQQISVPCKSIYECKSRLEVVIKKIHRIRTLAEILSDVEVEVEPVDTDAKKLILPVDSSICDEFINETKCTTLVIEPIERNNNAPTMNCFKRKSTRLSNNKQHDLSEVTRKQFYLTPFILFEKYSENDVSQCNLKDRYNKLTDSEKMIWIRKTITSASEDQEVVYILTEYERGLLRRDLKLDKGKNEKVDRGKENKLSNLPQQKRKLQENDTTYGFVKKKFRTSDKPKFEISRLIDKKMRGPKPIEAKPVVEDIIDGSEKNECITKVEQLCSSAPKIEKKKLIDTDVSEIGPVNDEDEDTILEEGVAIEIDDNVKDAFVETNNTEEVIKEDGQLEIGSTGSDNPLLIGSSVKAEQADISIEPEELIHFEKPNLKQEVLEPPPRVFSRIKNFCNGWFCRIGNFLKKINEGFVSSPRA